MLIQGVDVLNNLLKPWGLDFVQLEKGSLSTDLQQTTVAEHTLQKIYLDKQVWQRGIAPANCLNIGILLSNTGDISWNNKNITLDTIEVFSPTDEFDVVSPIGFSAYTLSLHKNLIEKILQQCDLHTTFEQLTSGHQVFFCNSTELLKIKTMFSNMLASHFQASNEFCQIQSLLDVSEVILQELNKEDYSVKKISGRTRNIIIKRAFNYIENKIHQPIHMGELCVAAHTSLRTLNRCFKDKFNLSPKAVITLFRLHVFRKLIIQEPNQKIYVLAEQCGFWHMGKLGVDYKKTFGELPSHTRQNCLTS